MTSCAILLCFYENEEKSIRISNQKYEIRKNVIWISLSTLNAEKVLKYVCGPLKKGVKNSFKEQREKHEWRRCSTSRDDESRLLHPRKGITVVHMLLLMILIVITQGRVNFWLASFFYPPWLLLYRMSGQVLDQKTEK